MAIEISSIKPLAEAATAALGNPVKDSLRDIWALTIGDRIASWRLENAAKLFAKVNEEIKKHGLKLNDSVPESYFVNWFDEATKQDDESIQTLFSRLLAKALSDDDGRSDLRHLKILGQITPKDAQIFQYFFDNCNGYHTMKESDLVDSISKSFGDEYFESLDNLIATGLLSKDVYIHNELKDISYKSHYGDDTYITEITDIIDYLRDLHNSLIPIYEINATSIGLSFYKACQPIGE